MMLQVLQIEWERVYFSFTTWHTLEELSLQTAVYEFLCLSQKTYVVCH